MTRACLPLFAALIGAAVLTGCDETGTVNSMSLVAGGSDVGPAPLPSANLARDEVVVSGPEGYCIDPTTLRRSASGGFAAIASCNILSGGAQGPFVEPVLVTVTVSRAANGAPLLADLAAALQTDLLQERQLSAIDVGQMANGGQTAFDGSDPRHWRGAFVLDRHLIGIALYAPKGSPLLGAQGAAFLNTVSSRIRANSASTSIGSAEQSQLNVDPLAVRLARLFETRDL